MGINDNFFASILVGYTKINFAYLRVDHVIGFIQIHFRDFKLIGVKELNDNINTVLLT